MADRRSKVILGLFLVSAMVVLALSLSTGFALNEIVDSLEKNRDQRLLAEVQAASVVVSADELNAIQSDEALSTEYGAAILRRLDAFASLHSLTDIAYIRMLPSGELQYIVGSSTGTGVYNVTAAPFESNDLVQQGLSGAIVVTGLHDTPPGNAHLKAYSPVYDAFGSVVAVAAVGIDDSAVLSTDAMIRNLSVILLVCIALVIITASANVLLQIRKEQELQESIYVQKLMIEISQGLSSERSFDERLHETLSILGAYLSASQVCIINLSDKEAGPSLRKLWCSAESTLETDEESRQVIHALMRSTFTSAHPEKLKTVFSSNVKKAEGSQYELLLQANIRAFIWSPLIVQNEVWGVLSLDFSRAQRHFLDKDIQLVESAISGLEGAVTRELYSEQRELALNQAVRASEAKSEFLSNMSHEMRTPMNAIIGMTSIALNSTDVERKDYCLTHVKEASDHLLSIINDVLDMSNMQSDELTLSPTSFDIRKLLNDVARDYLRKFQEHKQTFALEIDKQIPPLLVCDKERLAQVIGNLLSNATKFTPDEGSVALRVKHLGVTDDTHSLRFEVQDSGIGLDNTTRDGLFGSFEQAESGTTRKYGGTGLGLAISQRLVELMGGEIDVDSVVDEGSTFYFTLSLKEATTSVSDAQEESVQ